MDLSTNLKIICEKKSYRNFEMAHKDFSLRKIKERGQVSLLKYGHRLSRIPGNLIEHRGITFPVEENVKNPLCAITPSTIKGLSIKSR